MYNQGGGGMYFNQDEFLLHQGRLATGFGLIGAAVGIVVSYILGFTTLGTILMTAFTGYLGLTGFWGGYKMNLWIRKYKYRMPTLLWHVLRILAAAAGVIMGVVLWGVFEHFILLLAMGGTGDPGLIASQIILLPKLGSWYADRINYNPSQVEVNPS